MNFIIVFIVQVLAAILANAGELGTPRTIQGPVDWILGSTIIADGQCVRLGPFTNAGRSGNPENWPKLGKLLRVKGQFYNGLTYAKEIEKVDHDPVAISQADANAAEREASVATRILVGQYFVNSGRDVERIKRILNKLLPPWARGSDWDVVVANDEMTNAWTYGGRLIVITTDLLDRLDDNELATVIGHELGHVAGRHIVDAVQWKQQSEFESLYTKLIFETVFRMEKMGESVAEAIASVGAMQRARLNRLQEHDADRLGLRYAFEAGYNVFKSFIKNGFLKDSLFSWRDLKNPMNMIFESHPYLQDRNKAIETEIKNNYVPNAEGNYPCTSRADLPKVRF